MKAIALVLAQEEAGRWQEALALLTRCLQRRGGPDMDMMAHGTWLKMLGKTIR